MGYYVEKCWKVKLVYITMVVLLVAILYLTGRTNSHHVANDNSNITEHVDRLGITE